MWTEPVAVWTSRDRPADRAAAEWRALERVVAAVVSGLGVEAELTAGSKDGGKDVILTCTVKGARARYYVEVKHWRSATRVGAAAVEQLLNVIVSEKSEGGLFLYLW